LAAASKFTLGMILRNWAKVFGLAFAGLPVQNWISPRWQSFSGRDCFPCPAFSLEPFPSPRESISAGEK